MRICLVSQEYPPETGGGGIGTQTYLKAKGLSARGHHVEVVSVTWNDARVEFDGPIKIHRFKHHDFGVPCNDTSTGWLTYSMQVAQKLEELNAENCFDIIQFPEYGGEGFVHQTNNYQARRARYVVQLHGPLSMFAAYTGWPEPQSTFRQVGGFMERTVIHHADGVMASSRNTADFCAREYAFPAEQIEVIHSGIHTDKFVPRPRVEDGGFPRILFVGNFVRSKGFTSLIDAALNLRARYPSLVVRLIGKGNEEDVKAEEERIAVAGATSQIQMLRYVPYLQLPEHYAWCDFFCGPSVYEPGPGNVYLEAMSCGRPVVACNTAGAPEVVLDLQTGLLIPPNDRAALKEAIGRLADDAKLRAQLGDQGRQWVTENFSVERYTDKVERFYIRVLAGKKT